MPARTRSLLTVAALAVAAMTAAAAAAQKKYDPGASDTEIKIGNIMPYSGPASSYGVIGKAEAAYFNKVNAEGGINGRKITFISYDDAYSPPKAIEQARKLVEGDEVLLIFQPLGTPSNAAIQKYMNVRKVPQLFVASGATKWGDPKNFPWTMGWQPNYQSEGRIYAKYILDHYPNGKIAVFWQNDDAGKDQFKGLKDGLGDKANANNLYGYVESEALVQVLKQCGDNLTRENVMKQAANLKNFRTDLMLPGITVNTSPDDYFPIEQMQLMKFNGEAWELFGDVITGEVGHANSN